jgi:hypothetical protein
MKKIISNTVVVFACGCILCFTAFLFIVKFVSDIINWIARIFK